MKFIAIIAMTPKEVSKRKVRLMEAYGNLEADTVDSVSIKMSAELERFQETHVDLEEIDMRCKILDQIIIDYTESNISLPTSIEFKTFLLPSITNCSNLSCSGRSLVICRPSRTENSVPVFTINCVLEGEIYRKICQMCKSVYYYNYFEMIENNGLIRTYYTNSESKERFFSTTNETFFEKKLLETLTEEIVTSNVQFVNWSTCYNRLKSKDQSQMSVKLVIPVWVVSQIWKRISVSFPVERDKYRNLDIEAVCGHLYPRLRQHVDKKWLPHFCSKCCTRLVVLDGDAKGSHKKMKVGIL